MTYLPAACTRVNYSVHENLTSLLAFYMSEQSHENTDAFWSSGISPEAHDEHLSYLSPIHEEQVPKHCDHKLFSLRYYAG